MLREASSNVESRTSEVTVPGNTLLYARLNNGELALRLGADCPFGNHKMLETGETVYSPVTQVRLMVLDLFFSVEECKGLIQPIFGGQEGPLLTEDVIKETEEFVLRTGRYIIAPFFSLISISFGISAF